MKSSKGNRKAPARAEEKGKSPVNPATVPGAKQSTIAVSREGTIEDSIPRPRLIVGMGASSGGSAPLLEIAKALKPGIGIAAVAIMHIEPVGGKNPALAALSGVSSFEVKEASEGMGVEADCLYVVPPGKYLGLIDGKFVLQDICVCKGMRLPIDHFFCSLALHQGFRCAGILVSGKDSDGTLGLSEIKAAGGRTIVQDPAEAQAPDMPKNAVTAGVVDLTLGAKAIGDAIISWAGLISKDSIPADEAASLRSILALLRLRAGHDFRCYKHGTLLRRIDRRRTITASKSLTEYLSHLLENEEEINRLRSDLLIGVTDFFRQPDAWRFLKEKILPRLVEKSDATHPIRAWVPACASGKEAYTLAMLLAEAVEVSGKKAATQIFATDTDEAALAIARSGIYSEADVKSVPAALLRKYFSRKGGRFQVVKRIREAVVFAPQNLTSDPPFSRLDLVSCRNLLIYLDHAVQKKIIAMFHFSLRAGGYLFLGNAETAAGNENLFETVSKKWRMYRRIGSGRPVGLELPMRTPSEIPSNRFAVSEPSRRNSLAFLAQQALLERFAPPAAIIDRKGQLLFSHGAVDRYITVARGESSLDMVEMAREGLRSRLRSAITNAVLTNKTVSFSSRVKAGKKESSVKVTVAPLRAPLAADGLLLAIFEDILPSMPRPHADLASPDTGFRQLEDELKVTREELQNTIEQLEASSEEQKASNEEVMAANEELQSTNEELETSKEELQSLNEELNTVNNRLQEKVDELEGTNNDMTNLFVSSSLATVFLDRDLAIKRFTPAVTGLLSLIPTDVGRPIADIVRKFTDEKLIADAKRVLVDLTATQREVPSESGQWFIRRITPYRTQDDRIEGVVVTFSEVTELKKSEKEVRKLADELWTVARLPSENPNPILRISKQGVVLYANDASGPILRMWGSKSGEAIPDPWRKMVAETFADQAQHITDIECGKRTYNFALVPIFDAGYVNFYGRDITERRRAEEKLLESQRQNEFLADIIETSSQPFAVGYPDGRMGLSNRAFEELTGYTAEELQSIDWAKKLTPPQLFDMEMKELDKLHKTGKPVRYEKEYIRKDGSIVPIELLVHLVNDADGKPQYYYSFVTDISERKKAQENLAFQSHLLENAHDAAIGLDAGFIINYWNESAERMYGWTAREAIGRKSLDLFQTVAVSGTLEEMTARIKTAGRSSFEVMHRTKDDRELFVEVSSSAIIDQDGNPTEFISICRDLTERNRAEIALREAQARTAAVLNNIADTFYSLDEQWRFTEVNPAAERAPFGRPATELLGRVIWDLYPGLVGTPIQRHYFDAAEKVALEHYEAKSPLNSRWYDVFMQGRKGGVDVYMRDITERKKAEQALRESEERYRNLVKQAPAGIYEIEFPSGRFTEVNDVMCQLLGYTRDELLAATAPQILDDEGKARFGSRIRKAQAGDTPEEAVEYRVRKKDRSFIWGLLNTTFRWDNGKIVGAMVVAHDITERRRAEDALRNNMRLLQDVMDGSTSPIFLKDLDGKFLAINAPLEKMLGKTRQEVIGKTDYDIAPREIADLWRSHDARVISSGKAVQIEEEADLQDGHHTFLANKFPLVDAQGQLYGVGAISHDITERKKIEQELQTTMQRFYRILSSMNFGILLVTDDNKVEFTNQAFCQIFELKDSPEQLLDLSANEMIDKIRQSYAAPDSAIARIRNIVAADQPVQGEDVEMNSGRSFLRDFIPIRVGEQKFGRLWIHMEITKRKQAEEALRNSEERYRNLFNSLIEGYSIIEMVFDDAGKPVDYRFLEVNEAFEEQTGLRGAQGKLMRELEPNHEQHWFDIYGKIATTGEPGQFVNEAKSLNRWFEVNAFRVGGDGSRKVAICFNDITRRKKAEIALQESEERFRLALKNAPVTVAAQDKDLRFIWAYNQRTIDPAVVVGKTDADIFAPEDAARLQGLKTKVLETGKEIRERTWITSNGKRVFLDLFIEPTCNENGEITGIGIATVDLTDVKLSEEALRQSEEKFRRIIETANEGVIMADTHGKMNFVNEKMADMLGYSVEEMVGKSGLDFMPPEQKEKVLATRTKLGNKKQIQDEFLFLRKNGSQMWTLCSTTPILDAKGEHVGNLAMHADITERKESEEKIMRAAEELRSTNEDLARFNRAAVDRELRMIEMKKEINAMLAKLGEPERYVILSEEGQK